MCPGNSTECDLSGICLNTSTRPCSRPRATLLLCTISHVLSNHYGVAAWRATRSRASSATNKSGTKFDVKEWIKTAEARSRVSTRGETKTSVVLTDDHDAKKEWQTLEWIEHAETLPPHSRERLDFVCLVELPLDLDHAYSITLREHEKHRVIERLWHLKPRKLRLGCDVSSSGIAESYVSLLESMTHLTTLYDLGFIDERVLAQRLLSNKTSLLRLSGSLQDENLEFLPRNDESRIESIRCSHESISQDIGAALLGQMPTLTRLVLATRFTRDGGLVHLARLSRLQELHLRLSTDDGLDECAVTNEGWRALEHGTPLLRILHLHWMPSMTSGDSHPPACRVPDYSAWPELLELHIPTVSPLDLERLASVSLTKLQTLVVRHPGYVPKFNGEFKRTGTTTTATAGAVAVAFAGDATETKGELKAGRGAVTDADAGAGARGAQQQQQWPLKQHVKCLESAEIACLGNLTALTRLEIPRLVRIQDETELVAQVGRLTNLVKLVLHWDHSFADREFLGQDATGSGSGRRGGSSTISSCRQDERANFAKCIGGLQANVAFHEP